MLLNFLNQIRLLLTTPDILSKWVDVPVSLADIILMVPAVIRKHSSNDLNFDSSDEHGREIKHYKMRGMGKRTSTN